jgi:hypothetical protein
MKKLSSFLDNRSGQEPKKPGSFFDRTLPWHDIGSTMRGSGRVKAAIAF